MQSKQKDECRRSTSFCKQLKQLENLIHINCTKYKLDISIKLTEFNFECLNIGLIESIKYYFFLIKTGIENNINYYNVYNDLNYLLKAVT